MLEKLFTSKVMLVASFLFLAAGLVAGVTLIRYPQILFPEAAEVQCPSQGPFKLYCTWGAPVGAVSYDYAVTKETANGNVELVKTETGITNTHANFDGYPDDKYTCSVYAYNDCGSKSQLAVGTSFSCTAPVPTPQAPQWAFNGVWQDPKEGHHCAVQVWFTQPEENIQHLRVEIWPDYDRVLNGVDRYRRVDFNKGEEDRDSTQVKYFAPDSQGRINVQFLNAIIKPGNQDEGWQAKVTAFSEGDASSSNIQMSWGNHPTCRGNNMPSTSPTPVDCRPRNCQDENASWLNKTFYFIPNTPGAFSDNICTQSIADLTAYCTDTTPTATPLPTATPVPGANTITGLIHVNGEVPAGKYLKIGAIPPSGPSIPYDSRILNPAEFISGYKGYQLNIPSNIETVVVILYPQFFDANGQNPEDFPSGYTITSNCRAAGDADNTCTVTTPVEEWINKNFTITIPAAEEEAVVQGDISGAEGKPDGVVDAADASVLMSNWGVPFGFNPAADLNNDGKVDALDASLLIQGWSKKNPG